MTIYKHAHSKLLNELACLRGHAGNVGQLTSTEDKRH